MKNPYSAPETTLPASTVSQDAPKPSKPLIPAVIGLFTYGSSSPYALVLCVEHYLRPHSRPIPWSTHVAAVLASIGTAGWFVLNLILSADVVTLFVGKPHSMYAVPGLILWCMTLVFFIWMAWRIDRFHRQGTPS